MLVTIAVTIISTFGLIILAESRQLYNPVETIEDQGYNYENHFITTEDGYILMYHRIPHGKYTQNSRQKPAALLMHGIGSTSAEFVFGNPKGNLAFILADLGYDVWLGNARGTVWSRNHTTLDPGADAKRFFDFSWHEIGYYDLAAAIDYILATTKTKKLHYIGHSQGGTAFLVLASTRPSYNKKIRLASLLSPAVVTSETKIPFLKNAVPLLEDVETLLQFLKIYELPFTFEIRKFLSSYCKQPGSYSLCSTLMYIAGQNGPLEKDQLPIIFSDFPNSAAIKQYLHFAQGVRNNRFAEYDYGPKKNIQMYGRKTPPSYDLSKISVPVAIYYSKYDRVVNYKDINTLIKRLRNVVHTYLVTADVGHVKIRCLQEIINPIDGELIKIMQKY